MPYAEVNGQLLYYTDSGRHGPAVVFSHGFLMDHTMFLPQVRALQGEYRCIAWDERGFGRTECDGQPFTFWDSADDCIALLDHLRIGEAVLVGMSQGGFLSLRAALAYPHRVRALVLIDTEAVAADAEALAGFREAIDAWIVNGPTDELLTMGAGVLLGDAPEVVNTWQSRWAVMSTEHLGLALECLAGREDLSDRLEDIECPAIIFHGDADVGIDIAQAHALHAGLANSQGVVPVPGAGHAANLTHPDVVNPRLTEFLQSLDG